MLLLLLPIIDDREENNTGGSNRECKNLMCVCKKEIYKQVFENAKHISEVGVGDYLFSRRHFATKALCCIIIGLRQFNERACQGVGCKADEQSMEQTTGLVSDSHSDSIESFLSFEVMEQHSPAKEQCCVPISPTEIEKYLKVVESMTKLSAKSVDVVVGLETLEILLGYEAEAANQQQFAAVNSDDEFDNTDVSLKMSGSPNSVIDEFGVVAQGTKNKKIRESMVNAKKSRKW